VLWFVGRTEWPETDVGRFLTTIRERIHINRAGPPSEPSATTTIVGLLLKHVLKMMLRPEGHRERRDERQP